MANQTKKVDIPKVELFNFKTNQLEAVPEDQVDIAVKTGSFGFRKGAAIPVINSAGQPGTVDASEIKTAIDQGYKFDQTKFQDERLKEEKFGDSPVLAGLAGAGRGITFGVSDKVLAETGLVDAETLRELDERNREASIAGEIAGTVLPALATGGSSVAARGAQIAGKGILGAAKAGQVVEGITAKALSKIIKDTGSKKIAQKIVERSLPKIAGSAVEGSFYGAGKLISEDALGRREFNAENLVSDAGLGAILGGAAGGLFGAAQLLVPVTSKIKDPVTGKVKTILRKFADKEDAALDLVGLTPAKKTAIKNNDPKLVEELPDFLKNKLEMGIISNDGKMLEGISKIKVEAGNEISSVAKTIDKIAQTAPQVLPTKSKVFSNVVKKLDDEFLSKYANTPGFSSQLAPIKKLRAEYDSLATSQERVSFQELHELRKQTDSLINFEKEIGKSTLKDKALREVRNDLRAELNDIAKTASNLDASKDFGDLFNRLRTANNDYHIAAAIAPSVAKKVDKSKLINFQDVVTGSVGAGLGGEGGLAVAALKKFTESDLKRRLIILTDMEKIAQKVNKTIDKSVNNFVSKKTTVPVFTPTSTRILFNSKLINSEDRKDLKKAQDNKDKGAVIQIISKSIDRLASDSEFLLNRVLRSNSRIAQAAPLAADELTPVIQRGIAFLASKVPRDPSPTGALGILSRKWKPSDIQISKFERYMQAVENPLEAISELESGGMSREAVEAIRVVYPDLYSRLQDKVMEKIAQDPESLTYQQRMQLGVILNIPSDASLHTDNFIALQRQFQPQEPEQPQQAQGAVNTTVGGLKNLSFAEDEAGGIEAVLRRRKT